MGGDATYSRISNPGLFIVISGHLQDFTARDIEFAHQQCLLCSKVIIDLSMDRLNIHGLPVKTHFSTDNVFVHV